MMDYPKDTIIRRCRFRTASHRYSLIVGETGRRGDYGKDVLWYQLQQDGCRVLFFGDDFSPSPMHAIDSDETVAALMSFLTLRPGDTDREYFDSYTPEQLAYTEDDAESLSIVVMDRFGEI